MRAVTQVGVELGAEQAHQQHRDLWVAEQRLLHVAIREGDRRLAQKARDRADDRDLAPRQPGAQHQRVEPIVLELAGPDAQKRLGERVSGALELLGGQLRPKS